MRYETIKRVMTAVATVAIVALGAGCSDGQLDLGSGGEFSINPYVSITADPMTVAKGSDTTLKYVVANAETIQIASADGSAFPFDSGEVDVSGATETEGSLQVTGLTETTTFVITAKSAGDSVEYDVDSPDYIPHNMVLNKSGQIELPGTEAQPDLVSSEITDSVTVTVVDDGPLTAALTANPDSIYQGESSTLTCAVTPAGATISVVDSNNADIAMDENCQAVVTPAATTVYTLTATNALTGETTLTTATVFVGDLSADSASITANGFDALAQVDSFTGVQVDFSIVPDHIQVTVEADIPENVISCTPALPDTPTTFSELTGSSVCDLTDNTKFLLISHIGGVAKVEDAVQVVGAGGSGRVAVTARPWAFEGEEVNVSVKALAQGDIQMIRKISIIGMDSQRLPKVETIVAPDITLQPISKKLFVPEDGIRVQVYGKMDEDTSPTSDKVYVKAVELAKTNEKRITKALIDPNDAKRTYFGTKTDIAEQGRSFSATTVRMLRNDDLNAGSRDIDIDLGFLMTTAVDEFVQVMLDGGSQLVNDFDYPMHAIAVEKVADADTTAKIYVGTDGAIVYSANDGIDWNILWSPFLYFSGGKNEEGTHESCAGDIARGTKSKNAADLTSLMNVCDIVLDGEGMIAATDAGLLVIKDLSKVEKNQKEENSSGNITMNKGAAASMPMFEHVVNDLELVGDTLYAAVANGTRPHATATERGVYKSVRDGDTIGITWEKFGEIPGDPDVYYVMADMHDDVAMALYAATETGVYATELSSASWQQVGSISEPIFTLADDPYSTGDIIAGGDGVVKLSRDAADSQTGALTPSAATWGDLVAGGIAGSGKITSIAMSAVERSEGEYLYRAAFGGAGGYLMGDAIVATTAEYQEQPSGETETTEFAIAEIRVEAIQMINEEE